MAKPEGVDLLEASERRKFALYLVFMILLFAVIMSIRPPGSIPPFDAPTVLSGFAAIGVLWYAITRRGPLDAGRGNFVALVIVAIMLFAAIMSIRPPGSAPPFDAAAVLLGLVVCGLLWIASTPQASSRS